ncbi:flagellar assembly protein FliH [Halomonas mongoliensis]|uniref:Flagellar assembly protein FliH n=1 Tax=Halomonas mongoliensis TaxID=321265 RepID=A0ABU1GMT9_9GAMM|nr:flagellar assembly protein FliH [Halomonas mongoliensis]MDR5893347.1 flagellar assembly protein FliH [Halomonas mongoliensis]
MSEQRPGQPLPRHDGEVSWQRWEMGELPQTRRDAGSAAPAPEETARRKAAFQRQAELHALREKAMQEAREEGYQAGYASGHAEGLEAGLAEGLEQGRAQARAELEQQLGDTLSPLLPLAQSFGRALHELDEVLAEELVELALATGRQLAGEALKARPKQVLEIVRGLLHTEPGMSGKPRLWLHPRDHALVEEHLGHELAAAGWMLQPDDQVTRGGCRVTSASGELDATWESRWAAVKRQVRRRATPKPPEDGDR